MLQYYFKLPEDESFTSIREPQEGCWIHADEVAVEDLEQISILIGLNSSNLLDALDKYEVPRIEKIQQNLLIFLRYPCDQEIGLYTSPITIILTSHYLITLSPLLNQLVQRFLSKTFKEPIPSISNLLITLLFSILQEFTSEIKKVRSNVLKQEKEMINVDSEDISTLTKNEEVLNQYFSTLSSFRVMLEAIIKEKLNSFYEKEHEKIDDLLNAVKQSEGFCAIVLKSIRSLRDSYQIIFTNNLHKTIKLLTALTILFSIPTMIASLYGMNVNLPLAKTTFAFTWILLMIFGLSILGLWFFKRKRWL